MSVHNESRISESVNKVNLISDTMAVIRGSVLIVVVLIVCALFIGIYFWTSIVGSSHETDLAARCTHYSPAYPSAGGGGCSPKCTGRTNSSYHAEFHDCWPNDLVHNMHLAATVLKKYGTPTTLDTESQNHHLHVSFDYYCCYTPEEALKIGKFLNTYVWKPHEIWFDQIVCAIHGTEGKVSIVLMMDKNSQRDMLQWALDNERELEVQTGVHKHIPHTHLQGFHMTLATVNQSVFPVQLAVKEINKLIPPGTWHPSPITLLRPECLNCEKAVSTVKSGKAP